VGGLVKVQLSVEGLKVLVTAGASGIGFQVAQRFVENGSLVHICDVDSLMLEQCSDLLPLAGKTLCDVSDPLQVEELFREADQRLGGLDVLVNVAGIAGPTARVDEVKPADWDRTIAVDLNGQFYCARLAVPRLIRSGGGSILNFSSCSGLMGSPYRSPYCAAKWAIIGLTKTMAMELGQFGIRVNAICPGIVEGERMEKVIRTDAAHKGVDPEEIRQAYRQSISLGIFVDPDDIADLAIFLCSNSGRSISGQALGIDGNIEILR
jgi:NAD(P)-dependent dehydrogenase (short-subunit alcohol dehydrogenase family)